MDKLYFICPKCGRTGLEIVKKSCTIYPVVNIFSDGKLTYNEDEDDIDVEDSTETYYRCRECHFKLRNSKFDLITIPRQVLKWCKNNVPAHIPMTTKKLSATQTKAVRNMESGEIMRPYEICPRIGTLEALVKKGIVVKHFEKYRKFISPNLSWKYSLKYSLMEISHLLQE